MDNESLGVSENFNVLDLHAFTDSMRLVAASWSISTTRHSKNSCRNDKALRQHSQTINSMNRFALHHCKSHIQQDRIRSMHNSQLRRRLSAVGCTRALRRSGS